MAGFLDGLGGILSSQGAMGGIQKLGGMLGLGQGDPNARPNIPMQGPDMVNGQPMTPMTPQTAPQMAPAGAGGGPPPLSPSGGPPMPTPQPGDIQAAAPVQANVAGLQGVPQGPGGGGLLSGIDPAALSKLGAGLSAASPRPQPAAPPPMQLGAPRLNPMQFLRRQ